MSLFDFESFNGILLARAREIREFADRPSTDAFRTDAFLLEKSAEIIRRMKGVIEEQREDEYKRLLSAIHARVCEPSLPLPF